MIKLTVFLRDENCTELVTVMFAHIVMFDDNKLSLNFIRKEEQIKLMNVLIDHYVKFTCEGREISFPTNERQRLRYRFDAFSTPEKIV